MNLNHLLPSAAVSIACLATCALADSCLVPGEPDKPLQAPQSQGYDLARVQAQWEQKRLLYHLVDEYQLHVHQLAAWESGVQGTTGKLREELLEGIAAWSARVPEIRSLIVKRLESHPEEINDALLDHGSTGSVLYCAVLSHDVELVRLLLEKGAIPFLHEHRGWHGEDGDLLFRREGTKPEILTLLHDARSQYNVLEIMLQAQKYGVELRERWPKRLPSRKQQGVGASPAPD